MGIKRTVYKIKAKKIQKKYGLKPSEILNYRLLKDGIEKNADKIEHLFLGSSHGEVGINTNMFNHNAYNLCIGSQDLYYSFELYKKYVQKLKNLKNIFVTFSVFSSGYELQKTKNMRLIYYYNKIFSIPYKYNSITPRGGGYGVKQRFRNNFIPCTKELLSS